MHTVLAGVCPATQPWTVLGIIRPTECKYNSCREITTSAQRDWQPMDGYPHDNAIWWRASQTASLLPWTASAALDHSLLLFEPSGALIRGKVLSWHSSIPAFTPHGVDCIGWQAARRADTTGAQCCVRYSSGHIWPFASSPHGPGALPDEHLSFELAFSILAFILGDTGYFG